MEAGSLWRHTETQMQESLFSQCKGLAPKALLKASSTDTARAKPAQLASLSSDKANLCQPKST
jgi:hypothetical protein